MKRTLLAVAMLALFLPAARVSQGAEVSVDFFYNNLSGGSWIEVADYGYCWQPDVVVSNTSWRPYSDGYWAYTDLGWTWVSYEDFGWATYHYGRWARLADYGWCWVPGRDEDLEWGPAWVSWRTGGQYIGWAPLPPGGVRVYEGRAITGHVDVEFDIGPAYYNFVDVRFIGEPVLRERIVDVSQNVTYVNQTVNVTNITYKNKVVYNYGPDINIINTHAARPIQRLKLERQENVDISVAAKSGGLTKVQGDKLVVGAPLHIKKSGQQFAPPKVKAKVTQAKLDRGWSGVSDPNVKAQMQQKMKTEDAKSAQIGAAASTQATTGASPGGASPAASANAAGAANVTGAASPAGLPGTSPFEKGKGKGRGEKADVTGAQTGGSPVGEASPAGAATGLERGKGKGRRGEMPMTGGSPAGATATSESSPIGSSTVPEGGKHKGKREGQTGPMKPLDTSKPAETRGPTLGKQKNQLEGGNVGQSSDAAGEGQGMQKGRKFEQPPGTQGAQGIQRADDTEGAAAGGRERQKPKEVQPNYIQGAGAGPTAAGAEGPGKGQGKGEGKKQKGEASPVPSPQ
jgi:hypothetical protein